MRPRPPRHEPHPKIYIVGSGREGKGGLSKNPETLRRRFYAHPERVPPETKPMEVVTANRAMLAHYDRGPLEQRPKNLQIPVWT